MDAKLIVYELSNLDQYHKVLVNRALFGYIDNSNKGAYQYKRKGILSEMRHVRLLRGVVIVRPGDKNKIINTLNKHGVKSKVFNIAVKQSMLY